MSFKGRKLNLWSVLLFVLLFCYACSTLADTDDDDFVKNSDGKEFKILDLRLKDVGYCWSQDLEGRDGMNGQAAWLSIYINDHTSAKMTWKRSGIGDPFDEGDDRLVLDLKYSF